MNLEQYIEKSVETRLKEFVQSDIKNLNNLYKELGSDIYNDAYQHFKDTPEYQCKTKGDIATEINQIFEKTFERCFKKYVTLKFDANSLYRLIDLLVERNYELICIPTKHHYFMTLN